MYIGCSAIDYSPTIVVTVVGADTMNIQSIKVSIIIGDLHAVSPNIAAYQIDTIGSSTTPSNNFVPNFGVPT